MIAAFTLNRCERTRCYQMVLTDSSPTLPQTPAHDTCLLGQEEGSDKFLKKKIGCQQTPSFPSSPRRDCNCCLLNYCCLRARRLCWWLGKHLTDLMPFRLRRTLRLLWFLSECFKNYNFFCRCEILGSYIIEWLWPSFCAISLFQVISHNKDLCLKWIWIFVHKNFIVLCFGW